MKQLKDLMKAPDFLRIDPHRTKVNPFAGKYPTRWYVVFEQPGRQKPETWVGKPSLTIARWIERCLKKCGFLCVYEFDRGGAFRSATHMTPNRNCGVTNLAPKVGYFYYPWEDMSGGLNYPWARTAVFHKQMRLDKRVFFVYSPYKTMAGHQSSLKEYTIWLRKTNPWK